MWIDDGWLGLGNIWEVPELTDKEEQCLVDTKWYSSLVMRTIEEEKTITEDSLILINSYRTHVSKIINRGWHEEYLKLLQKDLNEVNQLAEKYKPKKEVKKVHKPSWVWASSKFTLGTIINQDLTENEWRMF
jgi:hypothetical protein